MLISALRRNWVWVAVAVMVPVGAFAATGGCVSGAPTPASHNHNFSAEAASTLSSYYHYAWDAREQASLLQTYLEGKPIDWELHAAALDNIRTDVNAMGAKVCRLEQIESALPATQRKEISQVLPVLDLMARHAAFAIRYLNENHETLWTPAYAGWVNSLYNGSKSLTDTLAEYRQFAKVHHKDVQLEQTLGVAGE